MSARNASSRQKSASAAHAGSAQVELGYWNEKWSEALSALLKRDYDIFEMARSRYDKDPNRQKAPLSLRALDSSLCKVWSETGSIPFINRMYQCVANDWQPSDAEETAALHAVQQWLDGLDKGDPSKRYPPYCTPAEQKQLDELRQRLRELAGKRLKELDPSLKKGLPGRRGYSLKALEFAKRLRQKNPEMKSHTIRQKCLKQFSEDDLPADDRSFRAWLTRKRKNAHEFNS